jgi:hypothetical protein
MFKNPWGTGLFGASFFSITGLHLTHVTCGVIALIVVGVRYKGGRYNADDIEVLGLYWHFVDLVWMFVVPLVYLLNLTHYGSYSERKASEQNAYDNRSGRSQERRNRERLDRLCLPVGSGGACNSSSPIRKSTHRKCSLRMLAVACVEAGLAVCSSCISGRKSGAFCCLSSSLPFLSCWGCNMGGPTASGCSSARHFQNDLQRFKRERRRC